MLLMDGLSYGPACLEIVRFFTLLTDRASTILHPVIYVVANPVRGGKEGPRSTGHIMVTTRYSDQAFASVGPVRMLEGSEYRDRNGLFWIMLKTSDLPVALFAFFKSIVTYTCTSCLMCSRT